MRKIKNSIIGVIIGVVAVCSIPSMAMAESSKTDYINSPQLVTNQWWSGYDYDEFHSVTVGFPQVYDGDVGVWFYTPSVGVTTGLARDTSRRAVIELKENDPGDDENELVHTYTGTFGIDPQGRYTVVSFIVPEADNECIEQNNVVELYLRFKVNKLSNDSSSNVNSGIMRYKLWSE